MDFPWILRQFIGETGWEAVALRTDLGGHHAELSFGWRWGEPLRLEGGAERYVLHVDWDLDTWSDVTGAGEARRQESSFRLYIMHLRCFVSWRTAELGYAVRQYIPGVHTTAKEEEEEHTHAGRDWRGGRTHEVKLAVLF